MTIATVQSDLPLALRPEQPEDEAFLFNVYASVREEEVAATGWPAEVRKSFLILQFKAMRQGYASMFPYADFSIVLLGPQPVGRLIVDRTEQEIRLVDIALLPAWRSQGIGTRLLRRFLVEAETEKKRVILKVVQNNPAARLYQRLGFQFVERSGVYESMQWQAPSRQGN